MQKPFIKWAGLIIGLSLCNGCSGTTLNSSSKNPQFTGKVNKVFIVGFAHEQETRQLFENSASEALMEHGVTGIASYKELPKLDEINDDSIDKNVSTTGADALLLTVATGRGTISGADIAQPETYKYELSRYQNDGVYPQPYYKKTGTYDYIPRRYKPYGFYPKPAVYSQFYTFFNPLREVVYEPNTTYETITIQTYLFDTRTKELIWSAELTTKNDAQSTSITGFIETVTADLRKQGLI